MKKNLPIIILLALSVCLNIVLAVFSSDDKLCLIADCLDVMLIMTKIGDTPAYINISK